MSDDLTNLTVLVTGASGGLGAQFARSLHAAGARVALAARRTDRTTAIAQTLGANAFAVPMDVTDEASVIAAFDQVQARFGVVDVVVNNAGINAVGLATDIAVADFDQVFAANVRGVFLCAREGARRLIAAGSAETGQGRVINIASIAGQRVQPGVTAYNSSKAAVIMMTRSLAREWARKGINVNAICPGYIETDINSDWLAEDGGQRMVQGFPRRRVMALDALDPMVLYLAGPRSGHVTGSIFTIDDGQSI